MLSREILQIEGGKELVNLMDVFEALPERDVRRYLQRNGFAGKNTLLSVSTLNYLYFDKNSGLWLRCKGIPYSYKSASCFEAIMEITGERPFTVGLSNLEGFDYVFMIEDDLSLYEVLYFDNHGKEKLLMFNNSKHTGGTNYVPVIVFSNCSSDALYERDGNGNEFLVPAGRYYTAVVNVKYNTGGNVEIREGFGGNRNE